MHVIVIGAGSIGSHVAYRLAHQGAQVTVIEAAKPGDGTSSATFAWLSSFPQLGWEEEPGRARLRARVHHAFTDLEEELDDQFVSWCGSITISEGAETKSLRERAHIAREKGVGVVELQPEDLIQVEPRLQIRETEAAFFEERSGWVDVARLIPALLQRVTELGGQILTGTPVVDIEVAGERATAVHTASGRRIEADAVVNASGSWGTHVAAMAGLTIPLHLLPGRIITSKALPAAARPERIINAPLWGIRPSPNGALTLNGRGARADGENLNIGQTGKLLSSVTEYLPDLRQFPVASERIGIRPVPPGGPIVGSLPWMPNFYFALSHGGIGWGPTWGWMAARELLHAQPQEDLRAMRPERFHRETEHLGRYADDAEQLR